MAHAKAKLTPLGRQLLVCRILDEGRPVVAAAESMRVSAQTAYKWLRRYRLEGEAGLSDRTSRPRRSPRISSDELVAKIRELRLTRRFGPHRIGYALGVARSTVYGVLCRLGLNRLSSIDRITRQVVRYQRERAGELLHVDVKRFSRLPSGGGRRMRGREKTGHQRNKPQPAGYDFMHVAIDDCTRVAYVEHHIDERGTTCAGFIERAIDYFTAMGAAVAEVMTDNAMNYRLAHAMRAVMARHEVAYILIRPHTPEHNGKVERLNRTLIEEWAYQRLFRSNDERLASLPDWVDADNRRRPHTALGGQSPMEALINNVPGNYS